MTDDPVDLLRQLVAIDSVNPDLVPGGAGEAAIADFCSGWLAARGFEVFRLEARPGRPSVVGVSRGAGGGRSLMFNGHYDTVTLAGYDGDPLAAELREGKVFGRGAFDMKSGVAAMMVAAARARAAGAAGDILVACVADEEYASAGTEEVAARFTADAAIVTEPSHLELTVAHKGFIWFDVTVKGKAAHGSRPELGVDAIVKAGKFLAALEGYDLSLRARPTHPILGSGSVHASLIRGGEELSSYPAECVVSIERRTVPGETTASVLAELRALLDGIAAEDAQFVAEIAPGLERTPFEVAESEPIVRALDRAATRALGGPPKRRGEPFWTDCAILQAAGIPCVMFGADGGGAHAATEWATAASVRRLADILTETALAFGRGDA
ncbi:ArgE/DapE family deacylase [Alsobacter sp. SYSU M60028]|uniref:Probable succinyl-diaminopimelate desuccinylase n=1 Tax=Alsobacter ponti TaxID=2962936 RepID=A0ABT1L9B6_9HYPH|nr:ArgE/DapE family deacylase [Alsobacter ponti]MCP8937538.1 ArgE/DapE family deacylase [Alsobacter ponti]